MSLNCPDHFHAERKANPFVTLVAWLFACAILATALMACCGPREAHASLTCPSAWRGREALEGNVEIKPSLTIWSQCEGWGRLIPALAVSARGAGRLGTATKAEALLGRSSCGDLETLQATRAMSALTPQPVESGYVHETRDQEDARVSHAAEGCSFPVGSRASYPSRRPSRESTRDVFALRAVHACPKADRRCAMPHQPVYFESHDVALAFASMRPLASRCTTPAAVRVRVKVGVMHPDAYTARGGALWTAEGLQRELAAERSRQRLALALGIKDGNTSALLQRQALREPEQLALEGVA